jgi:hypothetical protein
MTLNSPQHLLDVMWIGLTLWDEFRHVAFDAPSKKPGAFVSFNVLMESAYTDSGTNHSRALDRDLREV